MGGGLFKRNIEMLSFILSLFLISVILPDGYVTKTVNKGDNVSLSVVTKSTKASKLKWRKNAKEVIKFRGQKSILIEDASIQDSGIYECFVSLRKPHAVIRLIVQSE